MVNKKMQGVYELIESHKTMLESKIDSFRSIDSNVLKIRTEVNSLT